MSQFDVIIRNGMVVDVNEVRRSDIGIADGRIAELQPDLTGQTKETLDATGWHIFPGVIDAHVHFNEPGRTEWEGFETGSRAAAAGGTTTVFEMPLNAHPPTTNRESFESKRAAAEASSLVDFGLWGGFVPGNLSDLDAL